jgi:hypothetical protein
MQWQLGRRQSVRDGVTADLGLDEAGLLDLVESYLRLFYVELLGTGPAKRDLALIEIVVSVAGQDAGTSHRESGKGRVLLLHYGHRIRWVNPRIH